jgi:protocatechuate 3,4-dioxygenase beta subunit
VKKRDFLRKTLSGFGSIVALPVLAGVGSSGKRVETAENCEVSPSETRGPFPIKSPADLMRANIVVDRQGVALLINLQVQQKGANGCAPMANAQVDIWHCDADGHYSEYGGIRMQEKNYTKVSFLRGRQTADMEGRVTFISIFPGWYPGRAPHLHVDILKNDKIVLSTQIAFPVESTAAVYASRGYHGKEDTPNDRDGIFRNSLAGNMADSVTGNIEDGYTLNKVITVG